MTRADKLRSMSDEQLVDLIFEYDIDVEIDFCQNLAECDDGSASYEDCKRCLLVWLGSQVEGDENANDTDGVKELQRYRQIGTLEECEGYKNHSRYISKLHNCNDCGRRRGCEIAPQIGEYCRINCYLWTPLPEPYKPEKPQESPCNDTGWQQRIIIDDAAGARVIEIVKQVKK